MPEYATIFADLTCPYCGELIDDQLDVQWGRIPAEYHLGDTVKWRQDAQRRVIEPFTILARGDHSWNCGDPTIENLYLIDVRRYAPDTSPYCARCRKPLSGALVKVEGGRFTEARLLRTGELAEIVGQEGSRTSEIFVVAADGSVAPRPDWVDKTLKYRESP